jgi:plastocyanin
VPQATYDHWLAGKTALIGAKLLMPGGPIALDSKADGLHNAGDKNVLSGTLKVATTTRLVFEVQSGGVPVTLTLNDGGPKAFNGGPDAFYSFDVPTAGNYTLKGSNGGFLTITAVQPDEVRTIHAHDYSFDPNELTFEAGKTYQVILENQGGSTHDLHFGTLATKVDVASTPLVTPGKQVSVIFSPTAKGTMDIWCKPHSSLGMVGKVTVI